MTERIIRKYSNRRLYDTVDSKSITLADLAALIGRGERVRVREVHTDADLTREVLIQILVDQEMLGRPLLTEEMLFALVRCYHPPVREVAEQNLAGLFDLLRAGQARWLEDWGDLLAGSSAGMENLWEINQKLLDQWRRTFSLSRPPEHRSSGDDSED